MLIADPYRLPQCYHKLKYIISKLSLILKGLQMIYYEIAALKSDPNPSEPIQWSS